MADQITAAFFLTGISSGLFLISFFCSSFILPRKQFKRSYSTEILASVIVASMTLLTIFDVNFGYQLFASIPFVVFLGIVSGQAENNDNQQLLDVQLGHWSFIVTLLLLIIGSAYVRLSNLGSYGFRLDEIYQYRVAEGFYRTGQFILWDLISNTPGRHYYRAWLYTAQSVGLFPFTGVSLISGRIVSVVWGLLLLIPIDLLSRKLGMNRLERLIVLIWVAVSPYCITVSRWFRFYSMFAVTYVSFIFFFFRFLESSTKNKRILYLTVSGLTALVSIHLHYVFVLFIPAFLVFILWECWFSEHDRQEFVQIGLAFFLLVSVYGIFKSPIFRPWITPMASDPGRELAFFRLINLQYPVYLVQEQLDYAMGGLFLGGFVVFCRRRKFERYILCSVIIPVFLMAIFMRRFPQVRYAGHLLIIAIPIIVLTAKRFVQKLSHRSSLVFRCTMIGSLILLPLHDFDSRMEYIWDGNYGYVHFPQVDSPHYRQTLKYLESRLNPSDCAVVYYFYDLYKTPIKRKVNNFIASPSPDELNVERIKNLEETCDTLWFVYPSHATNAVSSSVRRYLNDHYQSWGHQSKYDVFVYRSD